MKKTAVNIYDNMLTAVSFLRVSSKKQVTDRQNDDINRYCHAFNIHIINTFKEKISGASNLEDRTALKECLDFVYQNKPNILIVSELSRLGRTNDVLTIIKKLSVEKICFISLKENFKTLDEDGKVNAVTQLMLNILAGISEFELSTISYRVTSGRNREVINNNAWSGGINYPYGYQSLDGKLTINEKEVPVIKLIFEKFAEGWGTIKLSNYLNNQKIPTRAQINGKQSDWCKATVYNIIKNKLYIGQRTWNNELLDRPELKIIDENIFNICQNRREKSKQKNFDFNKQKKYDYLLDNKLIKCGICGKHYVGIHYNNHYKCVKNKYGRKCENFNIKMDWLDKAVQWSVSSFASKIDLLSLQSDNQKEFENFNLNREMAVMELKKVNKDRLLLLKFTKRYKESDINAQLDVFDNLIEQIQKKIEDYNNQLVIRSDDNRKLKDLLERIKNNDFSESIPKNILHQIIKEIRVLDGKITVKFIDGELWGLYEYDDIAKKNNKKLAAQLSGSQLKNRVKES
jgi:DNA invertase Pin-like site-specific DNA recombinase